MSAASRWPGGATAAIAVTVDNLGEAAEINLGLADGAAKSEGHYSVTTALPIMLGLLAEAGLSATFFVEGVNAASYPDALREIAGAGHELAYHAWCHEDWAALDPAAEDANLDRGLAAFRAIGIEARGLRPPGGRLTPRTLELLSSRGLGYCSPAGATAGLDQVAVLPFAWPAVDAFHILPSFSALRERLTGNAEPSGPDGVHASLLEEVTAAVESCGLATLVLHTWLIELEREVVRDVLLQVRALADRGQLWAATCGEIADWMSRHTAGFADRPVLDDRSWTAN